MAITDRPYYARVDSGTANNPSINGDQQEPSVFTLQFSGEGTLNLATDSNGQVLPGSEDPNTLVNISGTIDGVAVSGLYQFKIVVAGDFFTSGADFNKLPDDPNNPGQKLFGGSRVYVIEITDNFNTTSGPDDPILNSGNPLRLYFLPFENATPQQMALFPGSKKIALNNFTSTPPPTCFAAGTIVETSKGGRAVETLEIGDAVRLSDGSFAAVVWISSSLHVWNYDAQHSAKPVEFRVGSLRESVPSKTLVVSPQHHILLSGPIVRQMFGEDEVLAPAKGLTGLPGVRVMQGKKSVEYYHVMLERHEIIMAHGVATESFYPGPTAVRMLTPAQRASLYAVVPALKDDPENGYGPTARKKITRRQAEELVQAMLVERKAKAVAAE